MSATRTQLTMEDLERIPDDGMHREILWGELILLPPPKIEHANIARLIFKHLDAHVEKRALGKAYIEAGYKLSSGSGTWLQPDVSFLSKERLRKSGYVVGAPEVAFEIISPSESASDIESKNAAYFQAGATAVVLVFDKTRTVRVCSSNGVMQTLREGEILSLPEVLPGWELAVATIFSEAD
ncbi:MAG: Uma2 family endonuclease [Candidatus Solibacter usitatus]|nr:Uma2 family endonuclease [Candidatus Solibacter usitatus]